MWRVLLSFSTSRVIFFLILSFFAIRPSQHRMPSQAVSSPAHSLEGFWASLHNTLAPLETPSNRSFFDTLTSLSGVPWKEAVKITQHPFFIVSYGIGSWTKIPIPLIGLFLCNVFLLLFLWELFLTFRQSSTLENALVATELAILSPIGFQTSLGSLVPFECFFIFVAFRYLKAHRWFLVGTILGLVFMMDWIVLGLLPLYLFILWSCNRGYALETKMKNMLTCLLPVTAGGLAHWYFIDRDLGHILRESTLFSLVNHPMPVFEALFDKTHMLSSLGSLTALIVLVLGAGLSFLGFFKTIRRLTPAYLLLQVCLFSSPTSLISRSLIAGICFEGFSATANTVVIAITQLLFIGTTLLMFFSATN